jgi:hypothetical protein
MRSASSGFAVLLVVVAFAAAALGLWMVAYGGYEPGGRRLVGSLFLAGAGVALLTAIVLRRAARRR